MDEDPLGITIRLAGVALLVLVNGFFVASEFALATVRRTRIEQLVAEGSRSAAAVKRGLDHLDDFVAAAQLGITMASLALGYVAEDALAQRIEPMLRFLGGWAAAASHTISFTVAFALITMLHIVVGEQAPKMVAIQHPERTALWVAGPTEWFMVVFRPFIRLLSWASTRLVRMMGMQAVDMHASVHTEEEIKMLLAAREEAGLLEPLEKEMIGRIFSCFDLVASQVMVPRTETISIASDATVEELLKLAAREGYERFPVYGENLDDIVGVVYMRDLVAALEEDRNGLQRSIKDMVRPIVSVPSSLPVAQVLARMKEHGVRMVLVLDEYGGTDGIVTWGGVLERIVGEVHEEDEPEEHPDVETLPDGSFSLSGLLLTEDVREQLGIDIEDEHNDTIGGVVFSLLGRKPEVGDEVELQGFRFRVEALDGLRIDRLRVLPIAQEMPLEAAG